MMYYALTFIALHFGCQWGVGGVHERKGGQKKEDMPLNKINVKES